MLKLWIDHVTWTREYFISVISGKSEEEKNAIVQRLLDNQTDLSIFIGGKETGCQKELKKLLDEHIIQAGDIISSLVNKNDDVTEKIEKWKKNAKEISTELSWIYYGKMSNSFDGVMQEHLDTTVDEIQTYLDGDYESSIKSYKKVLKCIYILSDKLSMLKSKGDYIEDVK